MEKVHSSGKIGRKRMVRMERWREEGREGRREGRREEGREGCRKLNRRPHTVLLPWLPPPTSLWLQLPVARSDRAECELMKVRADMRSKLTAFSFSLLLASPDFLVYLYGRMQSHACSLQCRVRVCLLIRLVRLIAPPPLVLP